MCLEPAPHLCQLGTDRIVCGCLGIRASTVVEAITAGGLRSVREVRRCTGAGDGCTACHRRLQQLLDEHGYPCPPSPSASSAFPICSVK